MKGLNQSDRGSFFSLDDIGLSLQELLERVKKLEAAHKDNSYPEIKIKEKMNDLT